MGFEMDEVTKNIRITRGDTGRKLCTLKMDKVPYEMQEGDEIHFGVKADYEDDECLIAKTYTQNPFILSIEPPDTKPLEFGTYRFDLEFVAANGFTRTFAEKKKFKVTEEVF